MAEDDVWRECARWVNALATTEAMKAKRMDDVWEASIIEEMVRRLDVLAKAFNAEAERLRARDLTPTVPTIWPSDE